MTPVPRLSLVICTYNKAELLDRTLAAIAQQQVSSTVSWQVLVVNNNCTDATPQIVEQHRQRGKIPQLSMALEPRQGLTYARLCGIQQTTSDWVAFVDDDCFLNKDWVEQAIRFVQVHPQCGAMGGRVILDWQTSPPPFVLQYSYSFAHQEHGDLPKQMTCLVGAGMLVNRAALAATGWLNQPILHDRIGDRLVSGGDVEIALRIRSAGYQLWYNPDCQLRHFIPSYRTSVKYLIDINYGLGSSQVLGDAMLWSGSYPKWFYTALLDVLRQTGNVSIRALKAILKRRSPVEIAIDASFIGGKWTGIRHLLSMRSERRRELLGAAKVPI